MMNKLQNSDYPSPKKEIFKRGPQELDEGQPKKWQKMDCNISRQCSWVLRTLTEHQFGWVFNQPEDSVKLNIPDYFSLISKPMDLGTIKSRLLKNVYVCTEDFADDIRLTFSNAMLYNPPSNEVHRMAKALNEVFEGRWKSFERKWNLEVSGIGMARDLSRQSTELAESDQNVPETPQLSERSVDKRSKPVAEDVKKSPLEVRPMPVKVKVKLTKRDQNSSANLGPKSSYKGTNSGGRHDSASDRANQHLNAVKCDATLERSCRDDFSKASSIMDCRPKSASVSQMTKSDPDSDVAVTSMDVESMYPNSQPTVPATDAALGEGLT